jgi:hypothetical protein
LKLRVHRLLSWTLGLSLSLGSLPACEHERVAHYQTRGVVRAFSGSGADARVLIQHEALPQFVDRAGKPAPMASMRMIFGLRPSLQDTRLRVDEKLRFAFDVTWSESPFLLITELTRLPADTSLQLSAAPEHEPSRPAPPSHAGD